MKRWVQWLAAAIVLGGAASWTYVQYFSTPAQIRAASSAFMRIAVSGDEVALAPLLAPDSPMTVTDIAQLYKGHAFSRFNVYPRQALPNGSGVTWIANTSTIDMSSPGYTRGTTLALKRVDRRWLIYKAGAGFNL